MSTAEVTDQGARRVTKSASAFRTISEVASDLDVPPHVLRFWESKFPQIKPLKRGGGRRYYRPEDVDLLRRIRELLYRDGYTIKGVQKLLKTPNAKLTDEDRLAPGQAPEMPGEDTDLGLDVVETPAAPRLPTLALSRGPIPALPIEARAVIEEAIAELEAAHRSLVRGLPR